MKFFDIHNIFFTALGYPVSFLEFFGTVTGIVAVFLSSKANIWSWPIGIVNVTLLFFLFFQIQLYPDMFLQIFFFITNIMGWWRWTHPGTGEEDQKHELRVSLMSLKMMIIFSIMGLVGTLIFGSFAGNLHELFPELFSRPSAYPYLDSFATMASVIATYLMVQKKIECWIAWLMANIMSTCLYFAKGVLLMGFEFSFFCLIVLFGFWRWRKEFKSYPA